MNPRILSLLTLALLAPGAPPPSAREVLSGINETAPEFSGNRWLNTAEEAPPSLQALKGKVVLVFFWSFGCPDCREMLRQVTRWQESCGSTGFQAVGIHAPRYEYEHNLWKLKRFLQGRNVNFPVLLDPHYANWSRYRVKSWPAIYLVDRRGNIRNIWEGTGDQAHIERRIDELLMER